MRTPVYALALLSAFLALPGLGASVDRTPIRFGWTPATGPVASYRVEVARNGGAFTAEQTVAGTEVTLAIAPGETVTVRVAALDGASAVGPVSIPSEDVDRLLRRPARAVVVFQ